MRDKLCDPEFLGGIMHFLALYTKDKWQYELSKQEGLLYFIHTDKLNHTYRHSWIIDELSLARNKEEIIGIVMRKIGAEKRELTQAEKIMLEILK